MTSPAGPPMPNERAHPGIGRRGSTAIELRGGFTAIELMVVLSIIILIVSMTVPSLVGSLRRGKVNDAANAIVRVSSQARQLARTRSYSNAGVPAKYYGVVLVNDETPGYVALTYGTTATKADVLNATTGKPLVKLVFNRNIVLMTQDEVDAPAVPPAAQPLAATVGWLYQYRTGAPIGVPAAPGPNSPSVNIGTRTFTSLTPRVEYPTIPADLKKVLFVQTLDSKYKMAFAIYQIGIPNMQEIP
jgi:type II secretory pathway pseudopilin PulG